jgi:hypothetical protein
MDGAMGASPRSNPVQVRDVLVNAMPQLREHLLAASIQKGWSQVVGAELGRRSRPSRLRSGVLDVAVDNSPWLHEMTLRSGDLLAAVQSRFSTAVSSLKFALGPVPAAADRRAPRRAAEASARLSREDSRLIQSATASLTDAALADSLRRLLTKDLLARRPPGPINRRSDSRPAGRGDS